MKAILIIDAPDKYEVDQLAVNYMLYSDDGKILDGDMGRELKPMPSIKYMSLKDEHDDIIFQMGWNACLDEILGEQK